MLFKLCSLLVVASARAAIPPPENENFESTEGLDLLWKLQADPANVAISSTQAELVGVEPESVEV